MIARSSRTPEVPPADEGKGIGARLVRAALDDARQRGFKIVPACSFVAAFVRASSRIQRRALIL